jgi:osomolarity two-component system response regulator SSK1
MAVEVDLGDNNDDDDDHMLFIGDTGTASPLHKSYRHIKFASEPTMKELAKFMENLKGLKMVLHANEQSVFAKHLTGCLASWNSDISHVPVTSLDDDNETAAAAAVMMNSETCSTPGSEVEYNSSSALTDSVVDYQHHHRHPRQHNHTTTATSISSTASSLRSAPATTAAATSTAATATTANAPHVPSPATEEEHILSIPPTFVLIDDHIMTLEHKLLEFRTHPPNSALPTHGRRHKHSKKNQSSPSHHHHQAPATAIIHFTSLTNYKRVRDTIQWASTLSTPFAMPRVVVVPKPAGPRRYLTALHTVWHNAMVEPHFIPIATSPSSPVPTVLLSSMLSQIVDPPSSITPPDPTVSHHHHLQPHHPHRPRRPVSGMFSPSFIQMQLQQHEGSNYFVDWPGSPFHRRRSFNELDSAHHSDGGDHSATTPTPTPTITALDQSPRPPGAQDESTVPVEPETTTASVATDSPPCIDQGHTNEVANPLVSKTVCSPSPSATDPSSSVNTAAQPDSTKPRLAKNIKINKRKKKEKRSPFANVVSPPINVLIVEGNEPLKPSII